MQYWTAVGCNNQIEEHIGNTVAGGGDDVISVSHILTF